VKRELGGLVVEEITQHGKTIEAGPHEIFSSLNVYGFVGLAFYDAGARLLYTGTKVIWMLTDVKGLRLQGCSDPNWWTRWRVTLTVA
jgi:hypothetical protein